MKLANPIWLASRSPRRRLLLEEAGIAVQLAEPGIDDAMLDPGNVCGAHWALAMAYLKARCAADRLISQGCGAGTVLAADTVCVHRGRVFGQPRDASHAGEMIQSMVNDPHETITGVSLIDLRDDSRQLWVDRTTVRIGDVNAQSIGEYVASGEWRGKAGGYNLSERIDAGWPIEIVGDPTTVMGLPMNRLRRYLDGEAR